MKTQFLPLGSRVSVRSEPEEYYTEHLRLVQAERRAYREARKDKTLAPVYLRAARRLSDHENKHYTS